MYGKEEIERMFFEDVREKKRVGHQSLIVKGGRRFKTEYDYLSRKERKKLNGEVESYNMNTIMNIQEFVEKDAETQKMLLIHWREKFSNSDIRKGMGIPNQKYYDLVSELNLPKKARGGTVKAKPRAKKETAAVPKKMEVIEPIKKTIMSLEFNGEYEGPELINIFTKLQFLAEGENSLFDVEIRFTEKKK